MTEFLRPYSSQEAERLTPKQWIAYHSFMGWINFGLRKGKTHFLIGVPSFLGDTIPRNILGFDEREANKVLLQVLGRFDEEGWKVENLDPSAPIMFNFRITPRVV